MTHSALHLPAAVDMLSPWLRPFALVILVACPVLASCGPPATEGGFDSANPAARMYAIEHAAAQGDTAVIKDLIEELDSDDPAVRYMAITALERLTGQTYGYHHYDSVMQRRDAIAKWVAAYESGSLQPMTSPPYCAASTAPHG